MTDLSHGPLDALHGHDVSIWLDNISRDKLQDGSLAHLIATARVVGVTSNPTIFMQAIEDSNAYDRDLADLARRQVSRDEAARALTAADIRSACDAFGTVFAASAGRDGRVSIEVVPRAADDTGRTVAEARALWWLVNRPNVMIKIPATPAGLPAITQATAEGISVNVTLIFSLDRYRAVMDAYLAGLEQAHQAGPDLREIRSVGSFFVSRVDTETDRRLEVIGTERALAMRGKAGVANARLAYEAYNEVFADGEPRWSRLHEQGAHPQRPLWASTGVKNPAYPDTLYVTELVGPGVVNTMPEATLEAAADHGLVPKVPTLTNTAGAHAVMRALSELKVDYAEVVAHLEAEGVSKFVASWEQLLDRLQAELERNGV